MSYFLKLLRSLSANKKLSALIAVLFVVSVTYQNCAPVQYSSVDESSKLGGPDDGGPGGCTLDGLDASDVMMSTSSLGGTPMGMNTLEVGEHFWMWLPNMEGFMDADWALSQMPLNTQNPPPMNQRPFNVLGSGQNVFYPPQGQSGLTEGLYVMRITVERNCTGNASYKNKPWYFISQAYAQNGSGSVFKDIYIPFTVASGGDGGNNCPPLSSLILSATDPKPVLVPVNFSINIPATCSNNISYVFGDGASILSGGSSTSHPYQLAGLYSASAGVDYLGNAAVPDRTLYKQVTIYNNCPTIQELFLSGPSVVVSGQNNPYQVFVPTNGCNLKVDSAAFNFDDGSNVTVGSPYLQNHIYINNTASPIVRNLTATLAPTGEVLSKQVVVLPSSGSCPVDASQSVFISGPTSGMVGTAYTYSLFLPDCIRGAGFTNGSVSWSRQPDGGASMTGDAGVLVTNITFKDDGWWTVRVRINNTIYGTLDLSQRVYIHALPSCSVTQPSCAALNHCSLNTGVPSQANQPWVQNARSCGYVCTNGYSGPNCSTPPVVNSCSTTLPACVAAGTCTTVTGTPTSVGQAWVLNAPNCGYNCNGGNTGVDCTPPPVFSCTGSVPANSSLCAGDDQGLTSNTPRTSVVTCTAGVKCEYQCTYGMTGGVCNPPPVNSCSLTQPACAALNRCNLTTGTPTSVGQAWVQNAANCGFACSNGWSGTNCTTAPPVNSCSATQPACAALNRCNLTTGTPTSVGQAWVQNAPNCGFACSNGWSGTNCTTAPPVNSCSTTQPACAALNRCNLTTGTPTSVGQAWVQNAPNCGFACSNGWSGTNCTTAPPVNSCSTTQPACAALNRCNLTTGTPTSVGQAWVQNAANCGFACSNGWSGTNCTTAPPSNSCSASQPACVAAGHCSLTAWAPTQVNQPWVLNASSCGFQCTGGWSGPTCSTAPPSNSCSASQPACVAAGHCSLTAWAPTQVNQPWVLNASSCGFQCTGGWSGPTCSTAPPANSCSSTQPACVAAGHCSLTTGTPTQVNQPWVLNASSCGFQCTGGWSGANCSNPPAVPVNGACGPSHNSYGVVPYVVDLGGACSSGVSTANMFGNTIFAGTYQFNWTCQGSNGGTTASCTAYGYNVANCGQTFGVCTDGNPESLNASAGSWKCRGAGYTPPAGYPVNPNHLRSCQVTPPAATCGAQNSSGPCEVQAYCADSGRAIPSQSGTGFTLNSIINPTGGQKPVGTVIGPTNTFDVPGYEVVQADATFRCESSGAWAMTLGRYCKVRKAYPDNQFPQICNPGNNSPQNVTCEALSGSCTENTYKCVDTCQCDGNTAAYKVKCVGNRWQITGDSSGPRCNGLVPMCATQ